MTTVQEPVPAFTRPNACERFAFSGEIRFFGRRVIAKSMQLVVNCRQAAIMKGRL